MDQAAILVDASFIAVYCSMRKSQRLQFTTFLMVFSIPAAAMLLLSFLTTNPDPKTAAFVVLLVVAGFSEIWYKMAGKLPSSCRYSRITNDHADIRYLVLCLACLAVAVTILYLSVDGGPLCFPESPFQGHGLWHVLNAVSAGFIFLYELSVHEETWRLDNHNNEQECITTTEDKGCEEMVVAVEPDCKI